MSRNRPPRPFPFAERARAVEEAREAVGATFRAMQAANVDRDDPEALAAIAWRMAAAHFHQTVERAYPHSFFATLEAARRGERAQLDDLIGFLEADPWFFRSGYIKADINKALLRLPLEPDEEARLRRVVLAVVDRRDGREFRSYCHLARRLATPELRAALEARLAAPDRAVRRRAGWMLLALGAASEGGPDGRC